METRIGQMRKRRGSDYERRARIEARRMLRGKLTRLELLKRLEYLACVFDNMREARNCRAEIKRLEENR